MVLGRSSLQNSGIQGGTQGYEGRSSPQNSETQGTAQEIWVGQGRPTKIRDSREQPGAWGAPRGSGWGAPRGPGVQPHIPAPSHVHGHGPAHTHTCTATATPAQHPYGHTRETHTEVTSHQCRGWGGRGDRGGPRGAGGGGVQSPRLRWQLLRWVILQPLQKYYSR